MNNWFKKLCGCHDGFLWSGRWGYFNFSQPSDMLLWRICMTWERIERTPGNLRWRLANLLSKWAHRLRGGRAYDYGYGLKADRAAVLEWEIKSVFIPPPKGMRKADAAELIEKVEELGRLANETTWQP